MTSSDTQREPNFFFFKGLISRSHQNRKSHEIRRQRESKEKRDYYFFEL